MAHRAPEEEVIKKSPPKILKYAKFVVALAGAVVTAGAQVTLGDGVLSLEEYVNAGIAFLTALGVFSVPNKEVKN